LSNLWQTVVAFFVLQAVGFYTWRYRHLPGARWLTFTQWCKALWLVCVALLPLVSLDSQRDLVQAAYSVLALLTCRIYLQCMVELRGNKMKLSVAYQWTVGTLLAFFILLALTNSWHHLYWSSVTVSNGVAHVHTATLGYLALLFGYSLIVHALWLNVQWARSCAGLRRRHAIIFILPTFIVWAGQALGYFPHPRSLDPHTISFMIAGIFMCWAYHRWRTFSILPFAQKEVLNTMIEGLIVVDDANLIVEFNHTLQDIFEQQHVKVGSSFDDLLRVWPSLEKIRVEAHLPEAELLWHGTKRYFRVMRTPLRIAHSEVIGFILIFKEVTVEKDQQQRIIEQQKTLSIFEERERLGRELHDGPGQMWSFLAAQSEAARVHIRKGRNEQAEQILVQLQGIIRQSYVDVRETISNLHGSVQDGLEVAIHRQAEWYNTNCDFRVNVEFIGYDEVDYLSINDELEVLRIVQESLANIRKHAGASIVHIIAAHELDGLLIRVEDDGLGFNANKKGHIAGKHGLSIMEARARKIGATLSIDSEDGCGSKVTVFVPIMRESEEDL